MFIPCKDCQARTIGCHGACQAYQGFLQEKERIQEARRKEYCTSNLYRSSMSQNAFRYLVESNKVFKSRRK